MKNQNNTKDFKKSLSFLIDTVKNLAYDLDGHDQDLVAHLKDYITVDIATEWEEPVMDIVHELFNEKIFTQRQVSIFEEISNRFIEYSNLPLYEKEIWTLKGLRNHFFWHEQRKLAKELLKEIEIM